MPQFAVHEVQRVVLDPSAVELKVKKLHLHESGHTELCLEAGGDSFTGSTQLVLVSGLPTVEVARKNVDLNGRYRVNPAGCGEREQPDSHFKIKLPKKAAAAAAAAIEEAVRQGRVTVK